MRLKTGLNPADINSFRRHTGKQIFILYLCPTYSPYDCTNDFAEIHETRSPIC